MLAAGEFGVVDARQPQEIRAPALEEFEVARMIDDARKVGIGELDADDMALAGRGQFAGKRYGRFARCGRSDRFTMIGHAGFPFGMRPDTELPTGGSTGWHF